MLQLLILRRGLESIALKDCQQPTAHIAGRHLYSLSAVHEQKANKGDEKGHLIILSNVRLLLSQTSRLVGARTVTSRNPHRGMHGVRAAR